MPLAAVAASSLNADSREQRRRRRRQGESENYLRRERRFGSLPFQQKAARGEEGVVYQSEELGRMVELEDKLDTILFKRRMKDPYSSHREMWGAGASNAIKAPWGRKIEAYYDGEGQRQANIVRRSMKTIPAFGAAGAVLGGATGYIQGRRADAAANRMLNSISGQPIKPANRMAAKEMKKVAKTAAKSKNALVTSSFRNNRPLLSPKKRAVAGAIMGLGSGLAVGKAAGRLLSNHSRSLQERSKYWHEEGQKDKRRRKMEKRAKKAKKKRVR